ncbi:hypothetical protein Tco_0065672 [Tanacetum coccineum]
MYTGWNVLNEHLLTFNQYKDCKTLFAAIQIRFGGNDATKNTQKNLLKPMYENFSASSTESLDSIFNRFRRLVIFTPNLDLSNSSLEEFQQPNFEGYGLKTSKSVSEDTSNEIRESPDSPLGEELVSNDKLDKKTVFPTVAKIEFVRPK